MRLPLVRSLSLCLLLAGLPALAVEPPPPPAAPAIDARPFPREFTVQGTRFSLHEPQYDRWEDDRLEGRLAMSVDNGTHTGADGKPQAVHDYGVVTFHARTQIDKAARAVVLTDIVLDDARFPTATAQQAHYLELARTLLRDKRTLTVSLDQLEAALAIQAARTAARSLPVRNDAPDIVFSTGPALLVLVDGAPVLKPTGVAGVQRVANTRSLLLAQGGRYYTRIGGHWAAAPALDGPWAAQASVDPALAKAADAAVAARQVDALDKPPPALQQALAAGQLPQVQVRTHPAELITTQGEPRFAPIAGTQLSFIDNTGADVFVDAAQDHAWYVLVSGRWFTASGTQGPWHFVAADRLPADFAKIPPDSPKSGVLASIPGTPESKEALIANSIPQTATVDRRQASLRVPYDGAPQFKPIAGTALQYAWNTPVPVIRVAADSYFAVDKGIWFQAAAATGPWRVATAVPAVIYTIPTSAPLHYVTYVRVYGSSADTVHVGYTPGYYGTVVSDGVVVYGTGYPCTPWVGAYWYGCPATYGMGVYFGWNAWVGWTFGWGWGWYDGWYGPYDPWWGPWWGPAYPWGYWGGGAAAWNVYGHWGNAAVRGTAAAWADPWTGNYGRAARGGYYNAATGGRGVGRAGINTNAYTGTTTAGAQGLRYNPQTGRVVAGVGGAAVNPYTGRGVAGGERTTIDPRTGRVTQRAGAAGVGPNGAAGAGAFDSQGARGDARGAGGFHYNADTGTLHHGGVVDINDNVYAGHDGQVYHYDNGQWNAVTRPDGGAQRSGERGDLDRDRLARERANQRISGQPAHDFQRPAGAMQRPVGGFRPGLGARPMGGFRRR
ncbi:hypothetical protein P6166_06710 [Stenotrophomonas sp. HITSZ_GD]|uniref:hypothetical protein n=1 Tax=Stenotrophomonas sp. HITSZ_GD TaxID=3037248 RepID=UPI00240D91B7|nr:hypothetical protein [Stenotrophomonas sp. HITSZ_GD]MDG2525043.1 hypothetical protein [Stenotrophomonas sp. HITSZ_GD]